MRRIAREVGPAPGEREPLAGVGQELGAGSVLADLGEPRRAAQHTAREELAAGERRAHALERRPGLEFAGAREEQREVVGPEVADADRATT